MPDLSIIVVNWNGGDLLSRCLQALYTHLGQVAVEVIVVDNASTDGSLAMLQQSFPQVRTVANQENVGFARANNQGVQISGGRYTLLLNSDAFVTPGALEALLNLAEAQPKAGLIGARLLNPDGSFQASHTSFPTLWQEFLVLSGVGRLLYGRWYPSHGPDEQRGPQVVDYVEGACLLARREAYVEVGGLDEAYFMYSEDVELCYAMREKGWQVWYQPAAQVIHLGGGSSLTRRPQREADLYQGRVRFFRRHYGLRAAESLKLLIYSLTAIKLVVHKLLQWLSRGRWGRPVVPLRYLAMKLRES
jgi:N-acetylglucosaminyl-diphospho-decaprenol L-rhamnosyltransferase